MFKARLSTTALAAVIAAVMTTTFAAMPNANAGSCMKVTGKGTGITEAIAKFMSEAAVKNGISNRGLSAAGTIKTTCTTDALVVSNCTSTQRAC